MITKFDSLYAGHTDLDNIGYGGTPINERRYSNTHLATALSKAESMATLMDGLGYNCFWMLIVSVNYKKSRTSEQGIESTYQGSASVAT